MKKFHVTMKPRGTVGPASFMAFQDGATPVPDACPVALLERKVTPEFKTVLDEVELELDDGPGKPTRRQVQRTRRKVRVERQSLGRVVLRHVLEVEAQTEAEAEAIYRKALGLNAEGTSRQIIVTAVGSPDAPHAPAPTSPQVKGRRKLSADDAASAMVGGMPQEG